MPTGISGTARYLVRYWLFYSFDDQRIALCSRCGEENPERAKFCLECGAELAETVNGVRLT